jgi:hypothetical protein
MIRKNIFFLNKDVEKEVMSDFSLYSVWRAGLGQFNYDDDIDPLHNPDYVRSQQQKEALALVQLRKNIEFYKNEFDQIKLDQFNKETKLNGLKELSRLTQEFKGYESDD